MIKKAVTWEIFGEMNVVCRLQMKSSRVTAMIIPQPEANSYCETFHWMSTRLIVQPPKSILPKIVHRLFTSYTSAYHRLLSSAV